MLEAEGSPTMIRDITKRVINIYYEGVPPTKTPNATVSGTLSTNVNAPHPTFYRVKPGCYGLVKWLDVDTEEEEEEGELSDLGGCVEDEIVDYNGVANDDGGGLTSHKTYNLRISAKAS